MNIKRLLLSISALLLVGTLTLYSQYKSYNYKQKNDIKIYDCFFYDGQIDLLDKRIELLAKHVDHFIILKKNTDVDVITHSKIIALDAPKNTLLKDAFEYVLNSSKELENCHSQDVVIFSDLESRLNPRDILATVQNSSGKTTQSDLVFSKLETFSNPTHRKIDDLVTKKAAKKRHLFFVF